MGGGGVDVFPEENPSAIGIPDDIKYGIITCMAYVL